ncbi:MAG: ABC transporter ATP-binding protein [Planctomycetota bacterium]
MATDSSAPTLAVRDLVKTFGDLRAVDGVTWEAHAGECFGLLGPNGAGKTTTIEICEGLTEADGGEVRLFGRTWEEGRDELMQRIGVQLQETRFEDKLTVGETVRLFRSFYDLGRTVDALLDVVELGEKRDARIEGLSGGQKQRVAMACALAGDPDLLFLDEPTTGLDPQARRQLWDVVERLKEGGRAVVLTTHYMDEAERLCDRIAIMDRGKIIAEGTPRELIDSLGAGHVVEVGFAGVVPDASAFDGLPGVRGVTREESSVRLATEALHVTVPAVIERLDTAGPEVSGLATHSATLEDVFVSLTGRQLRDE